MNEECAAIKEYAELCEAWERMGTLVDAPDYEEWLEQEYDRHVQSIEMWRARWKRKTERVHELSRLLSEAGISLP